MNYVLTDLPERTKKPRQVGYTMAMDKGLSLREVEDFIDIASDYTDIVKLGWATSYVTPKLKEKIELYRSANIPVYLGGTLFENDRPPECPARTARRVLRSFPRTEDESRRR